MLKWKYLIAASFGMYMGVAQAVSVPFVGTKNFSFGGVPAYNKGYTLTINRDHSMVLTSQVCYSERCDKEVILYKGEFKPMIKEPEENGYIQLNKKSAHLLNNQRKPQYDCDAVNGKSGPCVSPYYD